MLEGFEHQHAGCLADDQPVAIGREWPAGVASHRPQRLPALQEPIDQRRVGAAGEHHVGAAEPQLVGGRRKRVVGRGAGRRHREDRPAQPVFHADLAGRRAGHRARNGEDVGAGPAFDQYAAIIVLDAFDAEDADADDRPDARRIGRVDGDAGMAQRLARGDDRQQAEAVHGDQPPAVEAVLGKLLDLGAEGVLQVVERRRGDVADRRTGRRASCSISRERCCPARRCRRCP